MELKVEELEAVAAAPQLGVTAEKVTIP